MPRARKKVRLTSLDEMSVLIQKVRREYRKDMNQINAIKIIRESVPDDPMIGLKGAKDFFEYIREWGDKIPASSVAIGWCPKHWCPHSMVHTEGSGCVNGYEEYAWGLPMAAQSPQAKVAECDRPHTCTCGVGKTQDPSCTNDWHKAAYWITANPERWAEVLQQL